MNTSLGINFFRTVNEEGSNGWAQVYARIPFDDYELSEKGALFGVVLGKPTENWTEIEGEMMEWVDEYFNKTEKGGNLGDFAINFRDKYKDIEGTWLWVVPMPDEKREVKIIRWGNSGAVLSRNGQDFELTTEEGKVVHGAAMEKDTMRLWSGAVGEMAQGLEKINEEKVMELGNKMTESREAGAGLFFSFEKQQGEAKEETQPEEEKPAEEKPTGEEAAKPEMVDEELASETLIGPAGPKEKFVYWWKRNRPLKEQELRVEREEMTKRKKWSALLGVLFLVVLVVSLITGSLKIKADREAKKWSEFAEPITKSIQDAEELVKINPSGAKKLIDDAKGVFEVQKAEFINTKYKDDLKVLEDKLSNAWSLTSGEKESQIEEVASIQLVRAGFTGDRLSLVKGTKMLVLDGKLGTVVSVESSTKDIKVVAGKGESQGWIDAVGDGGKVLILSGKGVSVDGKETGGIVFDMAVSKPVALGRFGANVYILDAGNKEIFKYGALTEGYGDRTRWLKQDQSISVVPVDMAIDSDVWVLGDNGEVEKFRRGAREQFSLNGVPEGTKTSKLAVQTEGTSLAMLDTAKGVVIVCSKDTGNCNQQLKSEKLKTASDIEFDGSGNLLVLVAGTVGVLK